MATYSGCLELHNEDIYGKLIPDFPGYSIDRNGVVWSFKGVKTPRKLRTRLSKGYPAHLLYVEGKGSEKKVHTLMLMTYIGPRPDGYFIRHIDSNPLNNALSNLEYGTPAQNTRDAVLLGTIYGVLNKKTAKEVYDLANKGDLSGRKIAEMYGICYSLVTMIKLKKRWKHIHQ